MLHWFPFKFDRRLCVGVQTDRGEEMGGGGGGGVRRGQCFTRFPSSLTAGIVLVQADRGEERGRGSASLVSLQA